MIKIERKRIYYYADNNNSYTRISWHWEGSKAGVSMSTDTEKKFTAVKIRNTIDEGSEELVLFVDTKEQAEALKKAANDILEYLDEN